MQIYATSTDIALAVVAFAVILIPAIIIHELGHFLAARLVGISVLEFGIGFPPRLCRLFMWRETEFTFNLLPIGGFVRPLGEDMIGPVAENKIKRDRETIRYRQGADALPLGERETLLARGVDEREMMSVNEAAPLGRLFFMGAGAMANFVLAMLLFFIVALIGLPIKVGGLSQIADIPEGSLFSETAVEAGDAIETINGERFTDFAAFFDALRGYERESIEFGILRPENGETFVVETPATIAPRLSLVQVSGVAEGSPAHLAGILPGDLITLVNGKQMPLNGDPVESLKTIAREYEGRELQLTLTRIAEDGQYEFFVTRLVPRVDPPEGEGRLGIMIRSQFSLADGTRFANAGFKTELIPQSVAAAMAHSLRTTADTFSVIASIPGRILDGSLSGKDARPISIIGISKIGGEFIQRSLQEGPGLLLNFMALISIFLGISNLLPIPALDGGRIVFVLLEILRGKPINPRVEARIHQIGILILLALGVLVMVYDLINPPSIP